MQTHDRSRVALLTAAVALLVAGMALGVAVVALVWTPAAAPPGQAPAPPAPVAAPEPVAPPVEGPRSPIPEPGEHFEQPIPPRRLVDAPAAAASPAAPGEVVPWGRAGEYVGQRIIAEGTVVTTRNTGRVCFLNFSRDWREGFYVVVFAEAFAGIPEPPETYYRGRTIRVRGEVRTYEGRPQIQVRDASQIAIVD